jgi:hypothetical protein
MGLDRLWYNRDYGMVVMLAEIKVVWWRIVWTAIPEMAI